MLLGLVIVYAGGWTDPVAIGLVSINEFVSFDINDVSLRCYPGDFYSSLKFNNGT